MDMRLKDGAAPEQQELAIVLATGCFVFQVGGPENIDKDADTTAPYWYSDAGGWGWFSIKLTPDEIQRYHAAHVACFKAWRTEDDTPGTSTTILTRTSRS